MNHSENVIETGRKKRRFPAMALQAVAMAWILSASWAAAADAFYPIARYAADPAEIYQQPSFDARVAIELEKGARLTLIGQQGEWFVARLPNDRVGWIHEKFLTGTPPPAPEPESAVAPEPAAETPPPPEPVEETAEKAATAPQPEEEAATAEPVAAAPPDALFSVRVKVASGRIRSEPDLDAPIALGMNRGEQADVVETDGKWYRVRLADGRTGWGHRMLFSKIDAGEDAEKVMEDNAPPPPPAEETETVETAVKADEPAEAPAPEPEPEPEKPTGEKILYDIQVTTDPAGDETIVFKLGGFYPPETFVLEEGEPKVVCDFKGIGPGEALRRRIPVDAAMIQQIRVGIHGGADPKVRAVVDLARNKAYSVEQVFVKGKGEYILTFKTTEAD